MEFVQSFLNLVFFPLMLLSLLFVLPPYWIFKISTFLFRSFFPEDVTGKVVLITGASSGIGEHVAYEYARRGARLALAARRKERLLVVAETARKLGSPDTLIISADVSIAENCQQMVQQTINHFGRVDHLVNNAGVPQSKFLGDYSDVSDAKEMESIMDINFWGTVHTTRFAIPYLRRSKGRIIVVSSTASWVPSPRLSIYSGSKGALVSLFDVLRIELGSDVKITVVSPGFIETEMTTIPKNLSDNSAAQASNEWWMNYLKRSRFPVAKVEGCAEAIVRSVCRGDRHVTEPKWMLASYCIKILCPELLECMQRFIMVDFCKKFM